jgi:hypothetical protein
MKMMEFRARLLRLIEFALKLSQAKGLLREIKAHPSVSPFLVNGRIRRTTPGASSHYTATFDGFREKLADPSLSLSTASLPNSRKRRDLLTPGIGIEKKSAPGRPSNYPVLSVLAHEYGHALQPSGHDVLKKKLGRIKAARDSVAQKVFPKDGEPGLAKIVARGEDAAERASIAVRLTAERDATLRGAGALKRAGAGPKEIGEYFADVSDAKGKVPLDDLMHHSYQSMYASAKASDPKVRRGGRRLTAPLFSGSMSSFQPKGG